MASMVGIQPIEFYYPDRDFGELNIVDQNPRKVTTSEPIQWNSDALLNRLKGRNSAKTTIYEQLKFLDEGETEECAVTMFIKASFSRSLSGLGIFGWSSASPGQVKYAIVGGKFPPSLTLNIDTGRMYGRMDDLDDIFARDFGDIPNDIPEDPSDIEAAEMFGFDYGTQGPRRYTESNYGTFGSAKLRKRGFGGTKDVVFTARAFDSLSPTTDYIDGEFTIQVTSNWSTDRDRFILNIRNQFFVDGKPVTNEDYLMGMKERGFFKDTCPRRGRRGG